MTWRNLQWKEGEKEKEIVNEGVLRFIENRNFIFHRKITARKSYLYRGDGVHLSDIGNDHLIEDFKLKIKQVLQ